MNTYSEARCLYVRKATGIFWIVLLASLVNALLTHVAHAQDIPPNAVFEIKVTHLKCYNADEDGVLSDGDEPYAMVALIKPDPFAGYILHFAATRVFNEVDRSDTREPNLPLMGMHVDSSVAIISQVMEEDGTGRADMYTAFKRAGRDAFLEEMRLGARDLNWIADVVSKEIRYELLDLDENLGDSDDLIGFTSVIFISTAQLARLSKNGTLTKVSEFIGPDVRYTLTIKVRRIQ